MAETTNIMNTLYPYLMPFGELTTQGATPATVTIPMAPLPEPPKQAKLDAAGNVPIGATAQAPVDGLKVEKTTTTNPIAQPHKHGQREPESVSMRMERFYPNKYANATREEKQKLFERYIVDYFKNMKGKTPEQITKIQLADFKKLAANTKDPEDYKMISERIYLLENPNQIPAAKSVTVEAKTPELRNIGEIAVASTAHKYAPENQTQAVDIIVQSGNETAQLIGASHASEFAVENQDCVHEAYFNLNNEKVQESLTAQLGAFDKSVQLNIYERTMTSEHQCILEQAAGNIYTLDKSNQIAATQMTMATGNEGAISNIVTTPNVSFGYDFYTTDSSESSGSSTYGSTENFQEQKISEKLETISKAKGGNKDELIKDMIKNASPGELEDLLSQLSPEMLFSVLNIVLDYNPSSAVLSKITTLIPQLDDKSQKEVWKKMDKIYSEPLFATKASAGGTEMQMLFLQSRPSQNDMNSNYTKNFSQSARDFQKKLVEEQNETTARL